MSMDYSIVFNDGNFEAYVNGKLHCIVDTWLKAAAAVELKRMELRTV